jgi:hypothetical protein
VTDSTPGADLRSTTSLCSTAGSESLSWSSAVASSWSWWSARRRRRSPLAWWQGPTGRHHETGADDEHHDPPSASPRCPPGSDEEKQDREPEQRHRETNPGAGRRELGGDVERARRTSRCGRGGDHRGNLDVDGRTRGERDPHGVHRTGPDRFGAMLRCDTRRAARVGAPRVGDGVGLTRRAGRDPRAGGVADLDREGRVRVAIPGDPDRARRDPGLAGESRLFRLAGGRHRDVLDSGRAGLGVVEREYRRAEHDEAQGGEDEESHPGATRTTGRCDPATAHPVSHSPRRPAVGLGTPPA